jgi:hypothetical protein
MDLEKCNALKAELIAEEAGEAPLVSIARFLDGNDDVGSIGCNLAEHPGVEAFRAALLPLLDRPDVEAVYAQIAEIDPDDELWPFADTVLVVGAIGVNALQEAVGPLRPDEISEARPDSLPAELRGKRVLVVWWD